MAPPQKTVSDATQANPLSPDRMRPVGRYAAVAITGDYQGYPELYAFIERMVQQHGFEKNYLYGVFSEAKRKQWTLDYMKKDAPGGAPAPGGWTRYRGRFLDDIHIGKGVRFWQEHATALQRASSRYGVPAEYIVGIMGVETLYGGNFGNHRILDALTTLAFDGPRRRPYFTEELEKYLLMTRGEGMDPLQPKGSFAGAMGLGQFMPGSFLTWAVDFDGDGRRDLWQPDDAIGSIANYFAAHGWQPGQAVTVAARPSARLAQNLEFGFDTHYTLAQLAAQGITPASSGLPAQNQYSLLRLRASHQDEYWLGLTNFYVITRYNNSTYYAMAVHQLAQAVKSRACELGSC
ncbi:MAG: lytic murein transglycosylase [Pseudomonadota bacterium]|jgi:membrane-bound lytic murein transglycosylase B